MDFVDFLVGKTVDEFRYPADGLRIVLDADGHEPTLYVELEQPFVFTDGQGQKYSVGDDLSGMGAVFSLAGAEIIGAGSGDGVLTLDFGDRGTIRCEPHPEWEAWHVIGGDPYYAIHCQGGGELCVFDRRNPPLTPEQLETVFDEWGLMLPEAAEEGQAPSP